MTGLMIRRFATRIVYRPTLAEMRLSRKRFGERRQTRNRASTLGRVSSTEPSNSQAGLQAVKEAIDFRSGFGIEAPVYGRGLDRVTKDAALYKQVFFDC